MKILIFGGTGEARELAGRLVALGHHVTKSLAGKTLEPLLPKGAVRIGGFGTHKRLRAFIADGGFEKIIDATHPFAEIMSQNLALVAADLELDFIRLCRPPWDKPEGAVWFDIGSADEADQYLTPQSVLFVTTGQGAIGAGESAPICRRIIRLIEPPKLAAAATDLIILDRPPFTLAGELQLMRSHGITHLLSKNSGGGQTRAKIDAAAELKIPVLMIKRPILPDIAIEVETVAEALALFHVSSP